MPGEIASVAVSPDGTRFGVVFLDAQGFPSNGIGLIDTSNGESTPYTLVAPVADGESTTEVLYADAMDFTADNRYVVYDAANALNFSDGSTLSLWSIYAIDTWTETTIAIMPAEPGIHTAYPNVAQTSDAHLVFDKLDGDIFQNNIVALNVYTGDSSVIASVGNYFAAPGVQW